MERERAAVDEVKNKEEETRLDTRQSSRGRLGRSRNAKTARNLKMWPTDLPTDLPTDTARSRVACQRLEKAKYAHFLVADTQIYTLPCWSVHWCVRRLVTFLNCERFSHYGSCPTVRDWIAVYPALFKKVRIFLRCLCCEPALSS